MSELVPLDVTLELPASEFMEHEGELLVRCPLNRVWVPLKDYYSEQQGSLLPLVGNVDYAESTEHWVDTRELDEDGNPIGGEPTMELQAKESPIVWKETVRILAVVEDSTPEGGALEIGVQDDVGQADQLV